MLNVDELRNQIINADCYDILKELPDKSIDLIFTDPPYGIDIAKDGKVGGTKDIPGTTFAGSTQWDKERPPKKFLMKFLGLAKIK